MRERRLIRLGLGQYVRLGGRQRCRPLLQVGRPRRLPLVLLQRLMVGR